MILVCNGDSWTQGDSPAQTINWEAKKSLYWYNITPDFAEPNLPCDERILYKFYDSEVWPKVLGRELDLITYNTGRLGVDNKRIARTTLSTINYLSKLKGIKEFFVVIGWTSYTRYPIYELREEKNRLIEFQARPSMKNLEFLFRDLNVVRDDHITYLLQVQNFLDLNNINYLFFNAFDTVDNLEKSHLYNLIDESKWIDQSPNKPHFKDFVIEHFGLLKKHGMSDNTEKYFVNSHPTDIAHIAWGEYLHKYTVDNKLINVRKNLI